MSAQSGKGPVSSATLRSSIRPHSAPSVKHKISTKTHSLDIKSDTSSEAMIKLKKLEYMLRQEKEARVAAERKIRVLVEERKLRKCEERKGKAAEEQLKTILGSICDALVHPENSKLLKSKTLIEQHRRKKTNDSEQFTSFLDSLTSDANAGNPNFSIRTNYCLDHKGILHFRSKKGPPSESRPSSRCTKNTSLVPLY